MKLLKIVLPLFSGLLWASRVDGTVLRGNDNGQEQREVQAEPRATQWDYPFVRRAQIAVNLTHLVKAVDLMETIGFYSGYYQSFMAYDDNVNDRTIVSKIEDECYVVFQGMNRHVIFDVLQTLNPLVKRSVFGTSCNVRRSFYNGYETRYADTMRERVDQCANSCGDEQCPVILSGHSTGASSAVIAALDPRIQKYNPITYAFGPLRGLVTSCPELDTSQMYRIVAANAGVYDAASDGSPKLGIQVGEFFIMDEMDDFYYIGKDDNKVRMPDDYNIHIIEVYLNRVNALANLGPAAFPLTLGQFPDGHWCTEHDECDSGSCDAGVCASSTSSALVLNLPGSPCEEGSMCTSGVCLVGKCTLENGKAVTGAPCVTNEDCDTDKCKEGFCLDKLLNGSWCDENFECVSDSCSGPKSWIGMHKCRDPNNPDAYGFRE